MINTSDDRIFVVCYPGGAGGSFLGQALSSSFTSSGFYVDLDLGHCHKNLRHRLPNIFHGPSIQSFEQELTEIRSLEFSRSDVWSGHYRNIVAIREAIESSLDYNVANNTEFVKINVDPDDTNHARFLATMLRKKANAFSDLSDHEFLKQTSYYIRSWYWIENQITREKTMNLCLSDVFSPDLENKFQHLLTDLQIQSFREYHQHWLSVQNSLYPDTMELLHD